MFQIKIISFIFKVPWIKVDFDKWKDEDEEKEGGDDGWFCTNIY